MEKGSDVKVIIGQPGALMWEIEIAAIFKAHKDLLPIDLNLLDSKMEKSILLRDATQQNLWSCIGRMTTDTEEVIYFVRGSKALVNVFNVVRGGIDGYNEPSSLEQVPEDPEGKYTPYDEYYGAIWDAMEKVAVYIR